MNITTKQNKNETKKVIDLVRKLARIYKCEVVNVSITNGLFKSEIEFTVDGTELHIAELQEKIRLMKVG